MNKRFLIVVLGAIALLNSFGFVNAHREVSDDDEIAAEVKTTNDDVTGSEQIKDEEVIQIPSSAGQ
jgi:hypothetical protein